MKDITVSFGREGRLTRGKQKDQNIFIKFDTSFREEQLAELKGSPLSVFICLALHMDENGECWVSNDLLMKETGYGRDTVIEAKKTLVEKGYISQTEKQRWTKELVRKRFPNNPEKWEEMKSKLGTWATPTFKLFPEDPPCRGNTDAVKDRHGNKPTRENPDTNNNHPSNKNQSFKNDDEEEIGSLTTEEEEGLIKKYEERQKKLKQDKESQRHPVKEAMVKIWKLNPSKINSDRVNQFLFLKECAEKASLELILKAMEDSKYKGTPFDYCKVILEDWLERGITTVNELKEGNDNGKTGSGSGSNRGHGADGKDQGSMEEVGKEPTIKAKHEI